MSPNESELPLTPLTMAILLSLAEGDRHGYQLMQDVESQTDGMLRPGTGSLYAALQRLMDHGLIVEAPGEPQPGPGRPRKDYRITEAGRAMVRAEARRMMRVLDLARDRELLPAEARRLAPSEGDG